MSGFCTDCGHKVANFEGLKACPACGSRGIPCDDANQVGVLVNWHELRLLTTWAENWQRSKVPESKVVYAIAKRLQAQFPDRDSLTLAGELGEVAKKYDISVSSADLRRDIAEQTGEETGLTQPPKEPR